MLDKDDMEGTTVAISIAVSVIVLVVILVILLLVVVFRKSRRNVLVKKNHNTIQRSKNLWALKQWASVDDSDKIESASERCSSEKRSSRWAILGPQRWSKRSENDANSNSRSSNAHELPVFNHQHLSTNSILKAGLMESASSAGSGLLDPHRNEEMEGFGFAGSPRMAQALEVPHTDHDSDSIAFGTGNARNDSVQPRQETSRRHRQSVLQLSPVLISTDLDKLPLSKSNATVGTALSSSETVDEVRQRPFYQAYMGPASTPSVYSQSISKIYSSLTEELNLCPSDAGSQIALGLGLDVEQPASTVPSSNALSNETPQQRLTVIGEVTEDLSLAPTEPDACRGESIRVHEIPRVSPSLTASTICDKSTGNVCNDAAQNPLLKDEIARQTGTMRFSAFVPEIEMDDELHLEASQSAATMSTLGEAKLFHQRPRSESQPGSDPAARQRLTVEIERSASMSGEIFDIVWAPQEKHQDTVICLQETAQRPESVEEQDEYGQLGERTSEDIEDIMELPGRTIAQQPSDSLKSRNFHLPTRVMSLSPTLPQEQLFRQDSDPFADDYYKDFDSELTQECMKGFSTRRIVRGQGDLSAAEMSDTPSSNFSPSASPAVELCPLGSADAVQGHTPNQQTELLATTITLQPLHYQTNAEIKEHAPLEGESGEEGKRCESSTCRSDRKDREAEPIDQCARVLAATERRPTSPNRPLGTRTRSPTASMGQISPNLASPNRSRAQLSTVESLIAASPSPTGRKKLRKYPSSAAQLSGVPSPLSFSLEVIKQRDERRRAQEELLRGKTTLSSSSASPNWARLPPAPSKRGDAKKGQLVATSSFDSVSLLDIDSQATTTMSPSSTLVQSMSSEAERSVPPSSPLAAVSIAKLSSKETMTVEAIFSQQREEPLQRISRTEREEGLLVESSETAENKEQGLGLTGIDLPREGAVEKGKVEERNTKRAFTAKKRRTRKREWETSASSGKGRGKRESEYRSPTLQMYDFYSTPRSDEEEEEEDEQQDEKKGEGKKGEKTTSD